MAGGGDPGILRRELSGERGTGVLLGIGLCALCGENGSGGDFVDRRPRREDSMRRQMGAWGWTGNETGRAGIKLLNYGIDHFLQINSTETCCLRGARSVIPSGTKHIGFGDNISGYM